ncbi:MAG TPA: hypothetical protein VK533_04965 [Sphingomonas sp.]|uniref:hypothetical protein n=1 Tax=Sphingomonas sp. TaxID=28214 RepID=UPI002CEFF279|nr:hypothetical protein [Sphingomonas sp.]HMI18875.1 hypothetical protein [Sphingomonas sp.]
MNPFRIALGATLALVAAPSQADPRTLDVLPSMTWQHARTGLTMPPYLGSLPRNEVGDFGTVEADLFLQYRGADGTEATIYVFHPGVDSVPLWFDRVQAAIVARGKFGTIGDAQATAFAVRPGAPATALRVTYPLKGSAFLATAAAAVPVADWLVVVRLSSTSKDAAAVDAELTAVVNGIGWPADKLEAPVAAPIKPCGTMPSFHKAKLIKPDMMQALVGAAVSGAVATDRKDANDHRASIPTYCRAQQAADAAWGVYRVEGEERGYVLALGDDGRAIGVQPSLAALVNKTKPAYSLAYMDLTEWRIYPDVSDQLPPEQALDIVDHTNPIASADTLSGKGSITINSAVTEKK